MRIIPTTFVLACALLSTTHCVRPGEERSSDDSLVGLAQTTGLQLTVTDGLAAVRQLNATSALLWAQAPVVEMQWQSDQAREIQLEVRNCMPGARLEIGEERIVATDTPRPTWCVFTLPLPAGTQKVRIAPPDWQSEERYLVADMGDIQTAMDRVHEVFDAISAVPDLRFVMSTGDVVQLGEESEYELFQEQLSHLNIPFFSTVGNHELTQDALRWHDRFGLYSVHFRFKGIDYSYVDSGNAGLDPDLYKRLDHWLEEGKDRVHIFGTHYPPIDPVGVRNAGFRSRNEASKLLVKLAEAKVDLTIYGHIHSYYKFSNAGIPAYISGGGGALPERLDDIDRHFLVLDVDPTAKKVHTVQVHRVDE